MIKILGIGTDKNGRCIHYHKKCDIAALKCAVCGEYYACFECHDEMCDHSFAATDETEQYPVVCGACGEKLTRGQYATGHCPFCNSDFNPRCKLHADIYFK